MNISIANSDTPINLSKEFEGSENERAFNLFKNKVKGFSEVNEALGFRVGDEITFLGGYNDDILYRSKIIGFDGDGEAFMQWDCYWFPIKLDSEKRQVKRV